MTIVRKWVGTPALSTSNVTASVGGTFNPGDVLELYTWENATSDTTTISTPAGWTAVDANTNEHQLRLFCLVSSTGAESIPTITWGSGIACGAVVVCYSGMTLTAGAPPADRASSSTTSIGLPSTARLPSVNGCKAAYFGTKCKTNTSNSNTFTPPANFSIIAQTNPAGSNTAFVLCEWIQTTATNIAANLVITGGTADLNFPVQSSAVILEPASGGGGGGHNGAMLLTGVG
jgi:hypothetical protein